MLEDLSSSVSSAVDLAVRVRRSKHASAEDLPDTRQLAQRIGAHVDSLRTSKQALVLEDIDRILLEVTGESVAAQETSSWDQITSLVSRLSAELANALPQIRNAVRGGQLIDRKLTVYHRLSAPLTFAVDVSPPWLARVAMIKEAAQFNAETEREVVRLQEELKDMLREIKLRVGFSVQASRHLGRRSLSQDQTLQESGVKVETLERRLEATRKQVSQALKYEGEMLISRCRQT